MKMHGCLSNNFYAFLHSQKSVLRLHFRANRGQRICGSRKLTSSKNCNVPSKRSFFRVLQTPFWLKLHNTADTLADLFALLETRLSDVVINSHLMSAMSNSLPPFSSLFYRFLCDKAALGKARHCFFPSFPQSKLNIEVRTNSDSFLIYG
uniref:Uncharacterized protein n=1 Tax=Parascaris univalens TaxID=6257 RepID=A0A914ZEG2_PARUN